MVKIHEKYIRRCIEIAKNGLGTTAPNPMVGCVIVHHDRIIGEGYTSAYGGNHAEINAMASVKDATLLKSSTLYVTLEPCAHHGNTPPCADAIIKQQIPRVVIGTMDTHSKVSGKGIETLKASGRDVIVGVLEADCKALHKRFFTFHNKKRPYIILKWAQTSNGYIAPKNKPEQKPVWITNELSRQLVHKWRAEEQAILVGTRTVLEDNPSLTVRDWTGKNPIRVVLDKDLKLPKALLVFDGSAKTIVLYDERKTPDFATSQDGNLIHCPIAWDAPQGIAGSIADALYHHRITSIIIEGGGKTLQAFIDENLWDEARVFTGPVAFDDGVKAPQFQAPLASQEHLMTDALDTYINNAL